VETSNQRIHVDVLPHICISSISICTICSGQNLGTIGKRVKRSKCNFFLSGVAVIAQRHGPLQYVRINYKAVKSYVWHWHCIQQKKVGQKGLVSHWETKRNKTAPPKESGTLPQPEMCLPFTRHGSRRHKKSSTDKFDPQCFNGHGQSPLSTASTRSDQEGEG
jgi:hypothetical protein